MIHSFIIQKGTKMTSLVSGLDPVILDEQFEETYHVTCTLCCEYCSVLFSVYLPNKQTNLFLLHVKGFVSGS